MITTTPFGWSDDGMVGTWRMYSEDATSMTAGYAVIIPTNYPLTLARTTRRLLLDNGATVTDEDRDRCLTAFDMDGADELSSGSGRLFELPGER